MASELAERALAGEVGPARRAVIDQGDVRRLGQRRVEPEPRLEHGRALRVHQRVQRRGRGLRLVARRRVAEPHLDVLGAGGEHVVDRGVDVGPRLAVDDRDQGLEERQRMELAARADDRRPAIAAIRDHRDAVGHDRGPSGQEEQLAEVVGLDELPVLDAREPDRSSTPRIVEIARRRHPRSPARPWCSRARSRPRARSRARTGRPADRPRGAGRRAPARGRRPGARGDLRDRRPRTARARTRRCRHSRRRARPARPGRRSRAGSGSRPSVSYFVTTIDHIASRAGSVPVPARSVRSSRISSPRWSVTLAEPGVRGLPSPTRQASGSSSVRTVTV